MLQVESIQTELFKNKILSCYIKDKFPQGKQERLYRDVTDAYIFFSSVWKSLQMTQIQEEMLCMEQEEVLRKVPLRLPNYKNYSL